MANSFRTFSGAMRAWVAAGLPMASPGVYEARIGICKACPEWESEGWLGMGKCKSCGCSGVKLRLETSKCPLDKWGPKSPT